MSGSPPRQTQLSLTFPRQFNFCKHCEPCLFSSALVTTQNTDFHHHRPFALGLDFLLDFCFGCDDWIMASPATTSSPITPASSPAVDVTARRSCRRCSRRMSSLTHDKHTICVSCRKVTCSVEVSCDECREWSTDAMADYLRHKKSLASKGKKPKVTTPSASAPLVSPSPSPAVS